MLFVILKSWPPTEFGTGYKSCLPSVMASCSRGTSQTKQKQQAPAASASRTASCRCFCMTPTMQLWWIDRFTPSWSSARILQVHVVDPAQVYSCCSRRRRHQGITRNFKSQTLFPLDFAILVTPSFLCEISLRDSSPWVPSTRRLQNSPRPKSNDDSTAMVAVIAQVRDLEQARLSLWLPKGRAVTFTEATATNRGMKNSIKHRRYQQQQ